MNYYNENDPKAAAWLRELIKAGEIPPGDVDTRSITEISPHELTTYTQQHFFAGIGGWSLALELAGWPASKPVRTGSCPCQPFSHSGLRLGEKDSRHLWPVFRDLITFGEDTTTFGEQVASAAGREWLSRVRADLEKLGYGVGAADLCSASVGAPNIRQRLYWMAHPNSLGFMRIKKQHRTQEQIATNRHSQRRHADGCGSPSRLGNTDIPGSQGRCINRDGGSKWTPWASSVGVLGNDGKRRRIEPGIPPVAARLPSRVALIRGSGNAINPYLAAEFIQACDDVISK